MPSAEEGFKRPWQVLVSKVMYTSHKVSKKGLPKGRYFCWPFAPFKGPYKIHSLSLQVPWFGCEMSSVHECLYMIRTSKHKKVFGGIFEGFLVIKDLLKVLSSK